MDTTRLLLAGALTGSMVWGLSLGVDWPMGWFGLLARVGIPSLLGLAFFGVLGSAFGVSEVREIGTMLLRRLRVR
jgi:putative peptidoglycan lipid II flippase